MGHEDGKKLKASDMDGDAETGGLLSPGKAWGDHICVYKYLRGEVKKTESRHLAVVPSDRTKGPEHILKQSQRILVLIMSPCTTLKFLKRHSLTLT